MAAGQDDREQIKERAARGIARVPTVVIRVGAVAAATASVLALISTFVPGLLPGEDAESGSSPAGASTAPLPEAQITVSLPGKAMVYATREQYATTFLNEPGFYDDQPDALAKSRGVVVRFDVDSHGFARGTTFPVTITVFERRQDGVRPAGRSETSIQLDRPDDRCGCDEWVELRRAAHGRLMARVSLYPSDRADGSALSTAETELVRPPRLR